MNNLPERIYLDLDNGTYTTEPAQRNAVHSDVEYIRNDPVAMRGAGYVPAVSPPEETVSVREYLILLNKYIDLKEQLDDALEGEVK